MFDGALILKESIGLFYFRENGVIQSLLHALKYRGRKDIGEWMGELIADRITDQGIKPDLIIPVPIHPRKRRKRGYNQAEIIARSISLRTGIPMRSSLLTRVRHSESNTKLGRWTRWENVGDSFDWKADQSGVHYLLVDDVLTTGSTIQACIEKALASDPNSRWSIATAALVWRD
jgi:ComF family protein